MINITTFIFANLFDITRLIIELYSIKSYLQINYNNIHFLYILLFRIFFNFYSYMFIRYI